MAHQFPEKAAFLFEPMRYKGICGGRGKAGSWSLARAALLLGSRRAIRVLCCRETKESLKGSLHQLLEDQIKSMGLGYRVERQEDGTTREFGYKVQKLQILGYGAPSRKTDESSGQPLPGWDGPVGVTEFDFAGLLDPNALKSAESYDLVLIEEAESVSKDSWDKLIPTIRKDPCNLYDDLHPSEIWLTWNPELVTADTHRRFILNPPANACIVRMSWRDNPFFPKILETERLEMLRSDPLKYMHVWEGECITEVEGAIFGAEIRKVTMENRICSVPYNPTLPVTTAWDLGFGDDTAIWFLQAYDGWWNFIDYMFGHGLTIADYVIKLQNKGYMYRKHYLPHDSIDAQLHHNMTGSKTMSVHSLLKQAYPGIVDVADKYSITDRLNAARTILARSRFDNDKCADGLECLRHYRWPPLSKQGVGQRKPLHDKHSHGADSYCTAAVKIKALPSQSLPASAVTHDIGEYSWLSG